MGFFKNAVKLLALSLINVSFALPLQDIDPASFAANDIIHRDVVVVGGGSSGTYAAVRLRDSNQSVIIIEQKGRLGGHTETYQDPVTKAYDDIGVIAFHNLQLVKDYFARFNVSLTLLGAGGEVFDYADFATGKALPHYNPPNDTTALDIYGQQLAKYPYLEDGFDLPDPVPTDLLLPFGDFIKKYSLQSAANFIANFAQGVVDVLSKPTIYVFKNISLHVLASLQTGFLSTTRHDNSELYEKAEAFFGQDVLFNSTVTATNRSEYGSVKVVVHTPTGSKLILAKKLVIAIEPVAANLAPFDLCATEHALFSKFSSAGYYTGALRNLGIPDNVHITNIGTNTLYNIPKFPGIYSISPTGTPNLHNVYYGSPSPLSSAQVQSAILADVKRFAAAGGTFNASDAEFAVFSSHAPFELTVSADAIRKGFYKQLYALQGQRNTFWTGAAWHTHDSSLLWQFTEKLIPQILGSL